MFDAIKAQRRSQTWFYAKDGRPTELVHELQVLDRACIRFELDCAGGTLVCRYGLEEQVAMPVRTIAGAVSRQEVMVEVSQSNSAGDNTYNNTVAVKRVESIKAVCDEEHPAYLEVRFIIEARYPYGDLMNTDGLLTGQPALD